MANAPAVEDTFIFNKSSDYASQMECGHGRIKTRECRILPADAVEDEEIRTRWNGLKTIVEITSTVDYGNRTAVTKRYYISDEDYPKARTTIYWHEDTGLLRTTCIGCWMLRSKRMHQETMLKFDAVALDILKDVDVLFTKILVKILRIIS